MERTQKMKTILIAVISIACLSLSGCAGEMVAYTPPVYQSAPEYVPAEQPEYTDEQPEEIAEAEPIQEEVDLNININRRSNGYQQPRQQYHPVAQSRPVRQQQKPVRPYKPYGTY